MVDASKNIKNKISSQKQNQTSLESGKSSRAVVVDWPKTLIRESIASFTK